MIRVLDGSQRDDFLELPGQSWQPIWHPDGRRLAFRTMVKGDFDAYWKDVTSAAPAERLLVTDQDETPEAFTPDGRTLIFTQSEPDGSYPQKRMTLDPPGQPSTLVPYTSGGPTVSKDGKNLAYVSDRSGSSEVYVIPLEGGPPERFSTRGGGAVAWSRDGRELYYARPPEIIAVSLAMEGPRLRPMGERVWARVEDSDPGENTFAVGPDGRILIALPAQPVRPQIRVILGWDREIAQKLGR
jgi:Tol biopolymer transport system component